ncbi:Phosphatidylglycerol--prolipoprotein diacylglyceryl transferase [Austwickia sp. TVS 96-490-7B]|uniref:prolipoprotein diacylglyceryl transferase n=1 Tax=Austwickia sp. TVS 96-490-7B TaxID=2830843 RepID=UPI001C56C53E|nr:prolipoprotein diacylglyceryl transferase [Austwickia sp. TVS 96-490-7B]MBW3086388.1 Phosphatidylglycerol--prolipoprotein diacylglyceryl transferase [Austwickia sp. TVS 96-490-7B]
MLPASIPSPDVAVWYLGPFPVRAYALCLLTGIVLATWILAKRLARRGVEPERALDVALWAVPFGIVGGRLYHVISSPQPYFGAGGSPIRALYIWEGGLGIWGAVALGALGAWLGCRRYDVPFLTLGDALAPGLALAQAVGRWGNWFNNELYGGPTDLPWGLEIHQWNHALGRAMVDGSGQPVVIGTFHPTFLYESLWCVALAGVLWWMGPRLDGERRPGRLFAVYVMGYTLGRAWIEYLRIDDANHFLGWRLNNWTSLVVFCFGAWWFWWLSRRTPAEPQLVAGSVAEPSHEVESLPPAATPEPTSVTEVGADEGAEKKDPPASRS